ncbi:MAG: hypothetical protein GY724_05265 [Actinomycetia bacterium]|nr:hypothetical protein [Actinomycetes bacterium]MCP4226222.1 hypothetical protein [Actinomycetes bacterium]MCP5032618.1 hypothetical protein [Actinomycetes bacterium]
MGLLRAVGDQLRSPAAALSALTDSIVTPTLPDNELPPASVATWVASHFAAVGVYFSSVLVGSAKSDLWQPLVIVLWLIGLSGLCWRLLCRLVFVPRGASDTSHRNREQTSWAASFLPRSLRARGALGGTRVASDLKLGFFIMSTYAAYLAVNSLGPFAIGGFLAVLAFTIGLRFAGLDALAGRVREPWYYTRSVLSVRALLTFGVVVVVSAGVFVFAALAIDPFLRQSEQTVEGILGLDLSRWDQLQNLVIGTMLLGPPALMVCEAIAAVSRHEAAVVEEVASYERRLERDGIAGDLHDGVILSTLSEVRALATSDNQKNLIDGLDAKLRDLHLRRLETRDDRSIKASLRRPLEQANRRGLTLSLETDRETLALVVNGTFAHLIERLMMIQINNSIEAEAGGAGVRIASEEETITVAYWDDGGGFDPVLIDRKPGGLARVRFDIDHAGGSLQFHQRAGRTVAEATLPRPGG